MPSGGKREGSGRPRLKEEDKRVRVVAWVTPETKSKIEQHTRARGQKVGQYLEEIFK